MLLIEIESGRLGNPIFYVRSRDKQMLISVEKNDNEGYSENIEYLK